MTPDSEYEDLLRNRGLPLRELFGIADIALSREDALAAADILLLAGRAILGGDVYFKQSGHLTFAYANWHANKEESETFADYVQRAHAHTVRYINDFPRYGDREALFSLVDSSESFR